MKINVTGFIVNQLKNRIKKAKVALVNKQKKITVMEKELSKYNKRK